VQVKTANGIKAHSSLFDVYSPYISRKYLLTMAPEKENPNALIHETSPYLQQHAYNPVQWYPWGQEALEKAKEEDKLIILSIGYSACHWCHVMERESFENKDIAAIMNEFYVNIKVDREERPDIDQIYMEAIQAMGLNGGWPLNVILLPDQRPFYGGTYFPPKNWASILQQVARAYRQQRDKIEESASAFKQALNVDEIEKYALQKENEDFNPNLLEQGLNILGNTFDSKYGGVDKAPKFPMPSIWNFILEYLKTNEDEALMKHLKFTLDKIAQGGIYDHIGGGFARYSVDAEWFAPHFEKMLYDNGQLIALYSKAFRLYRDKNYQKLVEQSIQWLQSELTAPDGGFYSALDADSEGIEGKYYTWSADELKVALNTDYDWFAKLYNTQDVGNWEDGVNILYLNEFPELNKAEDEKLKILKQKLLKKRQERIRPGLDNKILSGWNGLMISGLAEAYQAFGHYEYLEIATTNASFILKRMTDANGNLLRSYQPKKKNVQAGFLEDYAAVIQGLIDLYLASYDEQWLIQARMLSDKAIDKFYDSNSSLFFFTERSSNELIARKKEIFDNVIPSSNSIMAHNFLQIGTLMFLSDYEEMAREMIMRMKKHLASNLNYSSHWALTYLKLLHPPKEVVISGDESQKWANKLRGEQLLNAYFLITENSPSVPLTHGKKTLNDQTTAYVCENRTCQRPVTSFQETFDQLITKT
jgi:hypothetical protein